MAELTPVRNEPGAYLLGDKKIRIVEWREDWRYDTACLVGSGAGAIITSGQKWFFFRDLTGKDDVDCNISQTRRISRGEEMVINSFGVHVGMRQATDVITDLTDFAYILERLFLRLRINKDDVAEGPVMCYQPGIGIGGSTVTAAGSVLSNGIPSLASVRPLLVHQEVTSENDIDGILEAQGAGWITSLDTPASAFAHATIAAANGTFVKLMLNGYIKKAVGRN